MKKLIVILLVVFVCCGVAQAACPEQRWADPNNWFFTPDPNRIIGYAGICNKIESEGRYGFEHSACDEEGLPLNYFWSVYPVIPFEIVGNEIVLQDVPPGNYYLTLAVTDTPPDPNSFSQMVRMTYGLQAVPRNVPPVIEPELIVVPLD